MSSTLSARGIRASADRRNVLRRESWSVDALASENAVDAPHARHVATLALALFDATHKLVGAPGDDRRLLEAASRLHDIGYAQDLRHHAKAGREILSRRSLDGYTSVERRDMASAIGLQSPRGQKRAAGRRTGAPLPSRRALRLAAYLRIAEGLDFSHLQDGAIVGIARHDGGVRVTVRCPLFPPNVEVTNHLTALWREVFAQDLQLILSPSQPARGPRILASGMDVFECAGRLLYLHYRTISANLAGALRGEDDAPLHDIRIAIRKARTVLRAFRGILANTSARLLDRDLQRLNRRLGVARDLDVWIAFLQSESTHSRLSGNPTWGRFASYPRSRRQLEQATVRRYLGGSSFATLRTRIDRLLRIELPQERRSATRVPIAPAAQRAWSKHLRRAMKLAKFRHAESLDEMHRLRVALRRVRYLGAFLAPVLGPAVEKLRKRAHAVERALGDIRDTSLALNRIRDEGPAPPRRLAALLQQGRQRAVVAMELAWPRLEEAFRCHRANCPNGD